MRGSRLTKNGTGELLRLTLLTVTGRAGTQASLVHQLAFSASWVTLGNTMIGEEVLVAAARATNASRVWSAKRRGI